MRLDVLARRARFVIRGRIAGNEHLYFPLVHLKRKDRDGPRPVTADTDIVVEGYPRSGNTFAYYALRMAHEGGVLQIAHHLHAPAQFARAAKLGIPAVLLLRAPLDAVASFVQREPAIGADVALAYWTRFHEQVLPYKGSFFVAPFLEVTTNFDMVVAKLNAYFNTDFQEFDHSEENVAECFRLIEARDAELNGRSKPIEYTVARPSTKRQTLRSQIYQELEHPRLRGLRWRAEDLFDEISSFIGEPRSGPAKS